MTTPAADAIYAQWFLTAPVERIATRRGDPLGFRASANRFADALAPGLSNRTVDARWLTLLCWALKRSRSAWDVHGLGSLHYRGATRDFYDWLRPLELLWVARTLKLARQSHPPAEFDILVNDGRKRKEFARDWES